MKTTLVKCNCDHSYQDKKYRGKRVANVTLDGKTARCTVCGEKHSVKTPEEKGKSKKK